MFGKKKPCYTAYNYFEDSIVLPNENDQHEKQGETKQDVKCSHTIRKPKQCVRAKYIHRCENYVDHLAEASGFQQPNVG